MAVSIFGDVITEVTSVPAQCHLSLCHLGLCPGPLFARLYAPVKDPGNVLVLENRVVVSRL